MSFSRSYHDPNRVRDHVLQSRFAGYYALNTPGPGTRPPFLEDPQIRLQKWGANLINQKTSVESDLRGMTRPLNRDDIEANDFSKHAVGGGCGACTASKYATELPFVDDSRNSQPAWLLRGVDRVRWDYPIVNPQANLEKTFHDNIQTRILEKDYYTASLEGRR